MKILFVITIFTALIVAYAGGYYVGRSEVILAEIKDVKPPTESAYITPTYTLSASSSLDSSALRHLDFLMGERKGVAITMIMWMKRFPRAIKESPDWQKELRDSELYYLDIKSSSAATSSSALFAPEVVK